MKRFCFALVATSLTSIAYAATEEAYYPATMCQNPALTITNLGVVQNKSTSLTVTAYCPIPRAESQYGVIDVEVRVVDMHFDQNVTCTLVWIDANGKHVYSASRSSSGTNSTPQTLTIPGAGAANDGDTYMVSCSLPPVYSGKASSVVSYLAEFYKSQ